MKHLLEHDWLGSLFGHPPVLLALVEAHLLTRQDHFELPPSPGEQVKRRNLIFSCYRGSVHIPKDHIWGKASVHILAAWTQALTAFPKQMLLPKNHPVQTSLDRYFAMFWPKLLVKGLLKFLSWNDHTALVLFRLFNDFLVLTKSREIQTCSLTPCQGWWCLFCRGCLQEIEPTGPGFSEKYCKLIITKMLTKCGLLWQFYSLQWSAWSPSTSTNWVWIPLMSRFFHEARLSLLSFLDTFHSTKLACFGHTMFPDTLLDLCWI